MLLAFIGFMVCLACAGVNVYFALAGPIPALSWSVAVFCLGCAAWNLALMRTNGSW